MRLGTTSYIYPADILTNVRRLADMVEDVELVIFQADDPREDLPDDSTLSELARLGAEHRITYTVHLPLDLGLAGSDPQVDKAVQVVRRTRDLAPHAYVVHLDVRRGEDCLEQTRMVRNSLTALEVLGAEVVDLDRLCVENLENQEPSLIDMVLREMAISCCVDVGHLWKQGRDPLPHMEEWIPRSRVVHLHGVGSRDHKRLSLVPEARLDPVVDFLSGNFQGVVTLEVFSEEDLVDSLDTFGKSLKRVSGG